MWSNDYNQDADDSAGYADPLTDGVQALAVVFILSLCGLCLWVMP